MIDIFIFILSFMIGFIFVKIQKVRKENKKLIERLQKHEINFIFHKKSK